ncbi:probable DNA double-strand break repair Rad50 ATPase [Palaemon carinicauda]|uniref:probable DNA double-strand break repair Rad50 ATPase n=1 Tax=Palaemon carinicauda TaxID=392227 RepID=UPI0035B5879E
MCEKTGRVYDLTELHEKAIKGDKIEKKSEYKAIKSQTLENLIEYFENMLQENSENEGHLLAQSPGLRENLKRKSENIEKELQDYQEASSSGTQGYSASNSDDYEDIIKLKVMGRKQTADLRRKAKDRAFFKIRRIAMEEVFPEERRLVYGLVQVWEEALKGEKIEKMKKAIHEVIEKGNVKRHIQKFENAIRENLKEGDLHGQPRDFRNHLRRTTKDKALAQIRKLVQEEMCEKTGRVYDLTELHEKAIKGDKIEKKSEYKAIKIQTLENLIEYFENMLQENSENEGHLLAQSPGLRENLKRKRENIEKELQDYQEASSSGTQGYSASNSDDYEDIIKLKVMGRKQTADLRRKAKDRAFFKIRRIAMEEVFPEKRRLVYGLVQVWEEALKGDKIEKMKKVIHEVIEKGNVKRHIQKFENAIRGNLKKVDLGGQPLDLRTPLRRTTKDEALAQIRILVQEDMSEKTGRVYDLTELHENAIKGDKIEKKSGYKAIKSQIIENLIEYFENMLQKNSENEGHLLGQSRDLGSHLRRAAKDVTLARIRNILQEAIEEENFEE